MARQRGIRPANRAIFWAAVLAIVGATLAAAQTRPIHPDLAFYLYAARRVLGGAVLYRDIVEINPPLIIWFNLPAVVLARVLRLPDILAYRLIVSLVIAGLLVLGHRSADRIARPNGLRQAPYLLLVPWFILFPLAGDDFGQREHLLLALLVPYILVSVTRAEGGRVPPVEALTAGLFAGVGLALKPHFVLVWLAIEGVHRARSQGSRRRVTPELLGTLVALGVYVVAVIALTPDYFRIVGVLGPAYTTFMQRSLIDVTVLAPAAPRVLFTLLALAALRRSRERTPSWSLLAAATVGGFAAAALQRKGFSYHYYPALALAFTLLVAIAASTRDASTWVQRTYVHLTRSAAVTIAVIAAGTTVRDALRARAGESRALSELASAVRARSEGRPVGVLSYTINSGFPLMNEAGTTLASRFPCLWPLATSYWDSLTGGGRLRYHAPAEMRPAERFMWDAVRADLVNASPNLLIILRPGRDVPHNGLRRLNYIAYFGRHPTLAQFFENYQFVDRKGEYLMYERVRAGALPVGPHPSPHPDQLDAPVHPAPALGMGLLDSYSRAWLAVFGLVWTGMALAERRRRPDRRAEGSSMAAEGGG